MRYIVSRTSHVEGAPVEGSYKVQRTRVDRRSVDDPSKIPAFAGMSAWWFEKGTNHRIEDGKICRDIGVEEVWVIDIDDLLAFVREHGECILSIGRDGWPEIEIYDDYRG